MRRLRRTVSWYAGHFAFAQRESLETLGKKLKLQRKTQQTRRNAALSASAQ